MNETYIKAKLCEVLSFTGTAYVDLKKLMRTHFHPDYHEAVIGVLAQMWYENWVAISSGTKDPKLTRIRLYEGSHRGVIMGVPTSGTYQITLYQWLYSNLVEK